MRSIAEFFSRIQNKQARELFIFKVVQEAVKKHAGIDLDLASISFKAGTAMIRGLGQTAKSQIFTKKPLILGEIAGQPTSRLVSDIRFDA